MITVQHNLSQLNGTLQRYAELSKLSWPQILAKHGSKLTYAISARLRAMMPSNGKITSEMLEALGAGKGVKVRPSIKERILQRVGGNVSISESGSHKSRGGFAGVRTRKDSAYVKTGGKRLSLSALAVKSELAARERGRGYLGFAARIRTDSVSAVKEVKKLGRYMQQLATAGLITTGEGDSIRFVWGGMSPTGEALGVGEGLSKARQQQAIALGISDVDQDIMEYVRRKNAEALQQAVESGKAVAR